MLTQSEENYLKAIYTLSQELERSVSTNDLADEMDTKASSVTDMLKKLNEKDLVNYQKYQGCDLTTKGTKFALLVIRKHRLWETFLVSKLNFGWEEVHEIAEQLEHIHSVELVNRLDEFLGFPEVDPHGEPIPSKDGALKKVTNRLLLADAELGTQGVVMGVENDQQEFLQYLNHIGLQLGTHLKVIEKLKFDDSVTVEMNGNRFQFSRTISKQISIKI